MTSLIAAIGKFAEEGQRAAEAWQQLGLWVGLPLFGLVVGTGLFIRFSKVSRLLCVDALHVDPANSRHLIGRKERVDQLERMCRDSWLVHLSGESGAGKSALARAGLVPRLQEEESSLCQSTLIPGGKIGSWALALHWQMRLSKHSATSASKSWS
ncbi:MAG: hypothetical protein CMJ78_26055 [Planctomycetaceae bacterium]|nr:hypothetical protein [Planctomycetaceae bacterium]